MHAVFDPLDPTFLADPYPAYRRLRDEEPVHHHPKDHRAPQFWVLSRFEDIWASVRRPEVFSSAEGVTFFRDEIGQLGLPPTLVMLDPPRQTQLRALIGRGFTPRRVAELEDRIRGFVRRTLSGMSEREHAGEPVDLHRELSSAVPTWVLAELFGLPEQDRLQFTPWVQALTRLQNEGFAADALVGIDTGPVDGLTAVTQMFDYFTERIRGARQHPGDDLLGALVQAEVDGERLTDWDILGFCFVVVAGGSDTTASLISHTVMLTDEHRDQRDSLVSEPKLIGAALVECLRLESSVQGLARTTTEDVTLHGVTIPAGEKVLMLYGSANRDPREFGADAERLDVRRHVERHLAFSSGPHFCIGSHLARLQARVAVEELFAAHPQVSVDAEAGERHRSAFVRGWVRLPASLAG